MQQLKLSDADTTLALDVSAGAVALQLGLSVNLTGFYRLCIHDDPFSKHACSTVEGCKGTSPHPPPPPYVCLPATPLVGSEDTSR